MRTLSTALCLLMAWVLWFGPAEANAVLDRPAYLASGKAEAKAAMPAVLAVSAVEEAVVCRTCNAGNGSAAWMLRKDDLQSVAHRAHVKKARGGYKDRPGWVAGC